MASHRVSSPPNLATKRPNRARIIRRGRGERPYAAFARRRDNPPESPERSYVHEGRRRARGRARQDQRVLAGIGDGAAALVLSGAPGIGKTVLWERGVEEAASRGQRVLAHRAVEAEAGLAFTGLADLLTPVLDDVLPALAPPRRRALAVALLLEDARDGPPDVGAIGLAVLDALRALADSEAVVVAIDDIQWLDSSTAGVLPLGAAPAGWRGRGTLATLRVAPECGRPSTSRGRLAVWKSCRSIRSGWESCISY